MITGRPNRPVPPGSKHLTDQTAPLVEAPVTLRRQPRSGVAQNSVMRVLTRPGVRMLPNLASHPHPSAAYSSSVSNRDRIETEPGGPRAKTRSRPGTGSMVGWIVLPVLMLRRGRMYTGVVARPAHPAPHASALGDQELPGRVAHRGTAVTAAARLVEHQRSRPRRKRRQASTPRGRLFGDINPRCHLKKPASAGVADQQVLGLLVVLEHHGVVLPADAGPFVPAERRVRG